MKTKKWFWGSSAARVVLIGMIALSLVACGGEEKERNNGDTGTQQDTGLNQDEDTGVGGDTGNSDVKEVEGTISQPEEWEGKVTVTGYLSIEAAVTIKPCTTIYVAEGVSIAVQDSGSIQAAGTADCPVTIRSIKEDGAKGDWGYVEIYASASKTSSFEYTNFLHGGGAGDYGVLYVEDGAKVTVRNARFESISGNGVVLKNNAVLGAFSNVHFKDIGKAPLEMDMNLAGQLEGITGEDLGENWISLSGNGVKRDAVWKKFELPYYVSAYASIVKELKVEAGTHLLMAPGVSVDVRDGGAFKAQGKEGEEVVIRSSKAMPEAGDWGYVEIYASASKDSLFEHTHFLNGGGSGDYGALYVESGAKVTVRNARFESIAGNGVVLKNDAVLGAFSNVHFKDIGKAPLEMDMNLAGQLEGITGEELGDEWISLSGNGVKTRATWKRFDLPYYVSSYAVISKELTIEAGTRVLMSPAVVLAVKDNGSLKTLGTADARVMIESSKSGPGEGDWDTIEFYSSASKDSKLSYTTVRHGGGANYGAIWLEGGAKLTLDNVNFEENLSCDVRGGVDAINTRYVVCPN